MTIQDQNETALRRGTVPDPAVPHRAAVAFASDESALQHLSDHMLCAPECEAWTLAAPGFADAVDVADDAARLRLARLCAPPACPEVQKLYDVYLDAVRRSIREAITLGWVVHNGLVSLTFGTAGILSVVEDYLRTAMIPGQGTARAVQESRDSKSVLRRESGLRSGRHAPLGDREDRERRRREEAWDPGQRLYYRVFRPAVQHIRRQHVVTGNAKSGPARRGGEYGLLKEVLPPQSRLKYEHWRAFHTRCQEDNQP